MPERFCRREGNGIAHLALNPHQTQRIFRQRDFHRPFRHPSFPKPRKGWKNLPAAIPELNQIQMKRPAQFHRAQAYGHPRIRKPGIVLQSLRLLLIHLHKRRITVASKRDGLLLPHGGKNAGGLPDHCCHRRGQDDCSQN